MTKQSKKVVIIVAISVVAVSLIAFFAIPVTVTLDYRLNFGTSDSYWNRPFNESEIGTSTRFVKVRVVRFSSYTPPMPLTSGFSGWYKDSALTIPWVNGEDKVSSSITLYAKWG